MGCCTGLIQVRRLNINPVLFSARNRAPVAKQLPHQQPILARSGAQLTETRCCCPTLVCARNHAEIRRCQHRQPDGVLSPSVRTYGITLADAFERKQRSTDRKILKETYKGR